MRMNSVLYKEQKLVPYYELISPKKSKLQEVSYKKQLIEKKKSQVVILSNTNT